MINSEEVNSFLSYLDNNAVISVPMEISVQYWHNEAHSDEKSWSPDCQYGRTKYLSNDCKEKPL